MKILHIIPRFTTGGAERLVLEYVKKLNNSKFKIVVASTRGGGELSSYFEKLCLKTVIGCESFARSFREIKRLAADWRPDIVHTHVFSSDVAGYLLKHNIPCIKWISTQHNSADEHSAFRKFVLRFILQRADKIIAVSDLVKDDCARAMMVPKNKVKVIENGINLDEWKGFTAKSILKNKTLRMASIGRLEKQKGHDILLSALSSVGELDWRLDVFGDGSLRCKLEKQSRKLKIHDKISWNGAVYDIPERLKDIDAVIQPSRWEGRSLAVMEAMAAGRAVVASVAAAEGLVQNMKTGLVVPIVGSESLTSAIRYLWNHKKESRDMAGRARAVASAHFGIDKHIEFLIKAYAEN